MNAKQYVNPVSIYVLGLVLLAVGLPLSKFLMSVSQILLAVSWLLHGNVKNKLNAFVHNVPALLFAFLFLLHLLGLLYTTNYKFALNDIRIKLPLLILPLIISTMPKLTAKQLKTILLSFVFAVFAGTIVSTAVLTDIIHKQIIDFRKISLFVSHIRFSLMICFSFCISIFMSFLAARLPFKIIYGLFTLWFIFFLFLLQSLTGLVCLAIVSFCLFSYYVVVIKRKWPYMLIYFALIITLNIFLYVTMKNEVEAFYQVRELNDFNKDPKYTVSGRKYWSNPNSTEMENGYYVNRYLCWEEVELAWNIRSTIKFNETDLKGNAIKFTLIRYVTSKGLKKDSVGIMKLTAADVDQINNGIANYRFNTMSNFEKRIYELIYEYNSYKSGYDISGHSVTQRLIFWKIALGIIKQNALIGVGTGDAQLAFDNVYATEHSRLQPQFRLRSHNQFLAFGVTFGMPGILLFLLVLFYPAIKLKGYQSFLFSTFFIISFISMFNEDTLETQAGVTFFTFFYCLLLFACKTFTPEMKGRKLY